VLDRIRVLIVDDEPLARRGIRQLLAHEPDVEVVGECRDGREALTALDTLAPDLVFLDVQMPELDGFGVVRERGAAQMPAIVFVTAHDAFAVRAFEIRALDYLVKPLTAARFAATVARVRQQWRLGTLRSVASQLQSLLALVAAGDLTATTPAAPMRPTPRDRELGRGIVVPTASGTVVVDLADVDWIEAEDYYVRIHTPATRHLVRDSLAALERRLDPRRFARVHRRAIVQLDRVREIRTSRVGRAVAILRNGVQVPVSRRRVAALTARIRHT
jgi:two-component system, LytTR family, response regulator